MSYRAVPRRFLIVFPFRTKKIKLAMNLSAEFLMQQSRVISPLSV